MYKSCFSCKFSQFNYLVYCRSLYIWLSLYCVPFRKSCNDSHSTVTVRYRTVQHFNIAFYSLSFIAKLLIFPQNWITIVWYNCILWSFLFYFFLFLLSSFSHLQMQIFTLALVDLRCSWWTLFKWGEKGCLVEGCTYRQKFLL